MKTNRTLTTVLAALLLATTFASCSRRDQFRPDETDALTGEQTTVAGQPDINNPGESNPTDTNQNGGDVTDPGTTTPDIPIGDPPQVMPKTARSPATLTRAGQPSNCMRHLWRIRSGRFITT